MSAPEFAASAVACLARSSSPSKVAAGWSGGASGKGAMVPCGTTTVRCGPADSGGVPYTLASQPMTTGAARATIAIALTSFDGRRRIALP